MEDQSGICLISLKEDLVLDEPPKQLAGGNLQGLKTMVKNSLLVAFFLTLTLEEIISIKVGIVTGLSAKNGFIYALLIAILCSKVFERSRLGIQYPDLHLLFILLIVNASISVLYMHLVSGDTAGYSLFGHVGTIKNSLIDIYLLFIVFFYGIESKQSAISVAKFLLVVVCLVCIVTLMDVLNLPDIGLVGYRDGYFEGPLGHASAYGVFFAFFLPILLLATIGLGSTVLRLVYMLGAVASFILLVQTGSRGGLVSLLGGLILAAWWLRGGYDYTKVMKSAFVTTTIAVILFTVVLITNENASEIIQQRIARSTEGNLVEVSSGRLWIWEQGLGYQMARPWTFVIGVGWWTFWDKIGQGPHNAYINYFFSIGVIGLGLFLALLYKIITVTKTAFLRHSGRFEERVLIGGLSIGWFVMIVAMITETIFAPWIFVWAFTGVCLRITYCLMLEESEQEKSTIQQRALLSPPKSIKIQHPKRIET